MTRQFPVKPYRNRLQAITPYNARLLPLASGRAGIHTTLRYMRQFAEQYKTHPDIRELALKLTRNLPQKDYQGEIRALWSFVKNHIRYVRDIYGVETVQTPLKTLEYGQGDCDDKATLLASLLESLGHPARFKAVGMRKGRLSHVYVQALYGNKWIGLETTEPVLMGWEPANVQDILIEQNMDGLWKEIKKIGKKIEKEVKRAGRKIDDEVLQKIKKPVVQVASVASAIPGPWQLPAAAIAAGGGYALAKSDAEKQEKKAKQQVEAEIAAETSAYVAQQEDIVKNVTASAARLVNSINTPPVALRLPPAAPMAPIALSPSQPLSYQAVKNGPDWTKIAGLGIPAIVVLVKLVKGV